MKKLYIATVIYLLLPNLLFLYFWLAKPLNILFCLLLIAVFYLIIQKNKFAGDNFELNKFDLFKITLLAIILTIHSGVGGFSLQTDDWLSHNSKYYTLFTYKWPIYISEADSYLCYYFGYFLVPSFLNHSLGSFNPNYLVVWSFLGISIGLLWFYILLQKKIYNIILLLILGGVTFNAAIFLRKYNFDIFTFPFNTRIISQLDQISFAVNQFIPSFILSGIFIKYGFKRKTMVFVFFAICLSLFWMVFPLIILCLMYAFNYFIYIKKITYKSLFLHLKQVFVHFLVVIPVLPIVFYLGSNKAKMVIEFLPSKLSGIKNAINFSGSFLIEICILFLLTQFVNYKLKLVKHKIPSNLINFIFLIFAFLMLFKIGKANDWSARIPMVMLFFLGANIVFLLSEIKTVNIKLFVILLLVPNLLILWFTAFSRTYFVVTGRLYHNNQPWPTRPYDKYPNIYQQLKNDFSQEEANQYLGDKNSIFYKYLYKK